MNKNDYFNEAMKNLVSKELGEGYIVTLNNVTKVNQTLPALNIRKVNGALGTNIYLDQLYKKYEEQGARLDDCARKILEVYSDNVMEEASLTTMVLDMMASKEKITDKVFYKIINGSKNEELLLRAPYTAIEGSDLVMIFGILVPGSITGNATMTITITNLLMERLELSEEEVIKRAKENTPRLFPAIFKNMTEILSAILPPDERKADLAMWVLSNEQNLNGASVLLYDGILDGIGERFGSFYILPSSLHEVIIVREGEIESDFLRQLVQFVNQTTLDEKDFLSDKVFHYNYTNHRLSVA